MNRTESLPMVALRGMTILPEMVAHFDISRERSIEAVQEAMASDQKIFLRHRKMWKWKIREKQISTVWEQLRQ